MVDYKSGNEDLEIRAIVYDLAKFLTQDVGTDALLGRMIVLVAHDLERCIGVSKLDDGTEDLTRIADDEYYSYNEKYLIALVVVMDLLLATFGQSVAQGNSDYSGSPLSTARYLSKAKAGPTEVEYSAFDADVIKATSSGFKIQVLNLFGEYITTARRIATGINCGSLFGKGSYTFPLKVHHPNSTD